MISIEEELRQSREAAEAIARAHENHDRQERLRGEMMARYSGGKAGPLDFSIEGSPIKLWKTWRKKDSDNKEVYSGAVTPKEFFERNPGDVNYTGIGRIMPHAESLEEAATLLKVGTFPKRFKNDFVSALYNGETPLEELNVASISADNHDIYRRILGEHYTHVTGENFRGYQLAPDSLPFAAQLNDSVRKGNYTQKSTGTSTQSEAEWALSDGDHFYDAANHQRIIVEHNGKKYYKLVDVFDTVGTSWLAGKINNAISKHEKPYVVTTPWRELPDDPKGRAKKRK